MKLVRYCRLCGEKLNEIKELSGYDEKTGRPGSIYLQCPKGTFGIASDGHSAALYSIKTGKRLPGYEYD